MASPKSKSAEAATPFLVRPEVGTALTIASGLSFLLTAMFLPLVGKAGARVYHYPANYTAFLVVLLVTLALSVLAIRSKLQRRKIDASPLPKFSIAIFSVSLLLLLALLSGLLKI